MKKLLCIAGHLSTGGMPQVLAKRIELIRKDLDVYVVEFNNYSNDFIVQKNRIKKLLEPGHFFTLGENKNELLDIINKVDPDFLHMEEMPELFNIDYELAKKIYEKPNRKYKIFETTHSSDYNVDDKIFMPDKFLFVSQYNCFKFNKFGIPTEVIEYPVEKKERNLSRKLEKTMKLKLDPRFKHVINVGLFTPRKNQAYAFEIARKLIDQPIMFHFIGNQADNFKTYWEPLMRNKPKNCIVWGERDDISDFLEASDLFLFTSRGFRWNKELNPLVIKEALEYQVPQFLFPLDVYNRKYDTEDTIHYLNGDVDIDAKLVRDFLLPRKNLPWNGSYLNPYPTAALNKYKIRAVHLLLEEDDRKSKSIADLEKLKDYGIDYVQHINKRYTEEPPREFCARPGNVGGIAAYSLRGPHYGNYQSFKKAILSEFTDDIDFLMVFESDCVLTTSIEEFANKIYDSCDYIINNRIYYMSFGDNRNLRTGEMVSDVVRKIDGVDWMYITNKIIGIQSILFPKMAKEFIKKSYETVPWDVSDLFFNTVFDRKTKAIAPRLTNQIEGLSTIQGDNIKHFLLKGLDNLLQDKDEKDILVEFNKNEKSFHFCLSDFFQSDISNIKIVANMGDRKDIYSNVTTLSPFSTYWIKLNEYEKYNDFSFDFYCKDVFLFTKKIHMDNTDIDLNSLIKEIQNQTAVPIIEMKEIQKNNGSIENLIKLDYNKEENKIYFPYYGDNDVENYLVSVFKIDDNSKFFEGKMTFSKNFINWVIPPKENDPYGYVAIFAKNTDMFNKTLELRHIEKTYIEPVIQEIKNTEDIFLVLTYPDTKIKEITTEQCLKSLKSSGKKIILSSHIPVSMELQKLSDYYLYDSFNPLIEHTLYNYYWSQIPEGRVDIHLNKLQKKSNLNQSLTVLNNIENAVRFAYQAGYKKLISVSYDFIFNDDNILKINQLCKKIDDENKKGYFMQYGDGDMKLYKSVFFIIDTEFYMKVFDNLRTPEKYNDECSRIGAHNFLENYYYNKLKNWKDSLIIEETDEEKLFSNPNINIFSGVEYLAILPVKNEVASFIIWFNSSNTKDDRRIEFIFDNNGNKTYSTHFIKDKTYYLKKFELSPGDNYKIIVNFIDSKENKIIETQTFEMNLTNYDSIMDNGSFTCN